MSHLLLTFGIGGVIAFFLHKFWDSKNPRIISWLLVAEFALYKIPRILPLLGIDMSAMEISSYQDTLFFLVFMTGATCAARWRQTLSKG